MYRKLSVLTGLVGLAMLLYACSGREPPEPAASKPAASAPAEPDWDKIRAAMAESLVGDRKHARHTAEAIPLQSEQLDPPAARKQVRVPPPVRPPPTPTPGASTRVAAAPPQAADKAIVEEAGPPKAAGAPPPATVPTPSPAKTPPTPAPRASARVAASAPPPGPAEKLAGGPRYRAQLGAFRSKGRALRAKRSLTDAFKGTIDERMFAIDDSGKDGWSRVVLSGTFATRGAATAACAVIKERGGDCHVTRIR